MESRNAVVRKMRAFNRFYTNIIGVVDRCVLDSQFSLTEARVLFEIDRDPAATARKIRNLLQVDEGYLSHTIEKLIRLGLVERTRSEEDKRSFKLVLSGKGRAEFRALDEKSDRSTETLLRGLSDEDIEALAGSMRAIERILGKGGAA